MLPRNNTAIRPLCVINHTRGSAKTGRGGRRCPIIAPMDDADELARRYFALWADYLTALLADPQTAALLQRWIAFAGQFATSPGEHADSPFPAWPPIPSATGPTNRSQTAAAAAAGASGERDDAVGELASRVDELERRLAALERGSSIRRSRRGNNASG